MSQGMRNIVSWSEEEEGYEEERHSLNDVVGEELIIEYAEGRLSSTYGEYVIIGDTSGREYYSFSKPILRQYAKLSDKIEKGELVKVKIRINKRRQVYFTKPDTE